TLLPTITAFEAPASRHLQTPGWLRTSEGDPSKYGTSGKLANTTYWPTRVSRPVRSAGIEAQFWFV
ncbi:hypothetical protein WG66_015867, partial [Moniliophthora roreri]